MRQKLEDNDKIYQETKENERKRQSLIWGKKNKEERGKVAKLKEYRKYEKIQMAEQRKQNNKDKRSAEKDRSKTEGE